MLIAFNRMKILFMKQIVLLIDKYFHIDYVIVNFDYESLEISGIRSNEGQKLSLRDIVNNRFKYFKI